MSKRQQISLEFETTEELETYENLVLPLKNNRQLKSTLVELLNMYYHNMALFEALSLGGTFTATNPLAEDFMQQTEKATSKLEMFELFLNQTSATVESFNPDNITNTTLKFKRFENTVNSITDGKVNPSDIDFEPQTQTMSNLEPVQQTPTQAVAPQINMEELTASLSKALLPDLLKAMQQQAPQVQQTSAPTPVPTPVQPKITDYVVPQQANQQPLVKQETPVIEPDKQEEQKPVEQQTPTEPKPVEQHVEEQKPAEEPKVEEQEVENNADADEAQKDIFNAFDPALFAAATDSSI